MYNYMYFQPNKSSDKKASKDEASNQVVSGAFKLNEKEPKIPYMT